MLFWTISLTFLLHQVSKPPLHLLLTLSPGAPFLSIPPALVLHSCIFYTLIVLVISCFVFIVWDCFCCYFEQFLKLFSLTSILARTPSYIYVCMYMHKYFDGSSFANILACMPSFIEPDTCWTVPLHSSRISPAFLYLLHINCSCNKLFCFHSLREL